MKHEGISSLFVSGNTGLLLRSSKSEVSAPPLEESMNEMHPLS